MIIHLLHGALFTINIPSRPFSARTSDIFIIGYAQFTFKRNNALHNRYSPRCLKKREPVMKIPGIPVYTTANNNEVQYEQTNNSYPFGDGADISFYG
jgi:hypothetical protein